VSADAALFRRITEMDPLTSYTNFPEAEEYTTGRLNGSEAHRPVIRVRLNATARDALSGGRLPAGARFPDGAIVVPRSEGPFDGALAAARCGPRSNLPDSLGSWTAWLRDL